MNHHKVAWLTLIALVILATNGIALAASPEDVAAQALAWLKTQQNADGGFGNGFGPGSGVGPTADAILAITSSGQDASTWTNNGQSPLDYLRAQVGAGNVTLPGDIAKVVLALVATGQSPHTFGGRDLIADLESRFDAQTGLYSSSMFDQSLAILALRNAGQATPDAALDALLAAQTVEGGWAFTGETIAGAADSNTTALAVQALVAAGRADDTGRALAYFRRVQNADAGWTYQVPSAFGTDTDANSTALSSQAILAAGQSLSGWAAGGSDPLGALIALQNKDGSFSFNNVFPGPNILATLQAIPALYGDTLVSVSVVRAASTEAAPPVLLPESGGESAVPALLAFGAASIAAGVLLRRRVRIS